MTETNMSNLDNEAMKKLASAVNAGATDAGASDEENAARQAAASAGNQVPTGSQSPEDLAAEAAAFAKTKAEKDAAQKAADAAATGTGGEEPTAEEIAAQAAKDEAEAHEDGDGEQIPWPTSTDRGMNAALGMMKDADMSSADISAVFGDAITTGDMSKVDVAALEAKLGKNQAASVLAGVTTWSVEAGNEALKIMGEVQSSVGGAENWATMVKWAKASDAATKAEVQEITKMLNGSPTQRRLGAAEFTRIYNADTKNATLQTSATQKTIKTDTPAPKTEIVKLTGSEAYNEKATLSQQRRLGKITVGEYNKGMASITARRQASR